MDEMPLFQQATLVALISELGKEDTAEVLKIFLADTSSKMSAIASDLQARSTIKREAHSIKSSSATFGFVELSRLARELESGAEAMSRRSCRSPQASFGTRSSGPKGLRAPTC